MASYGTFITACGFEYNGPQSFIKFAPKITPENFKAPFTAAEGWGSYEQKQAASGMEAKFHIKYGSIRLQTIALETNNKVATVLIQSGIKNISCKFEQKGNEIKIILSEPVRVKPSQVLKIKMT